MKTIELKVQPRTGTGKGANRRARAEGAMPGVVYGHDLKPKSISVSGAELKKLDRIAGLNVFINMKVDGDAELNGKTVRVREFQRSEEHTSELQSQSNLVCRLLLEKKKRNE